MTTQKKDDFQLSESYLKKLQKWKEISDDLMLSDKDNLDVLQYLSNQEKKKAAKKEDKNGFAGSNIRNLRKSGKDLSFIPKNRQKAKIETIPMIIGGIEEPEDKSVKPKNAELISIVKLAKILRIEELEVRKINKLGLIPAPIKIGGYSLWIRKEVEDWIKAGCPNRVKWENQKEQL